MTLPLLITSEPHPDRAEELRLFGVLAGSWGIEARLLDGGEWRESRGQWHFGFGLGGLAVVDVIHAPPLEAVHGGAALADIGTTVRVPDPGGATWQVTFVSAYFRRVTRLVARAVDGGIHQDGTGPDGEPLRWNFSEITPRSFLWQGFASPDGGATWTLDEEMRATRAR